ncbi:MAG: ureidoglycolate lyase [Cyanobacteria bacterium Co-bin13]|nr:ureidoglycolate lyase [Cyanobacteria bacterium Co-bin13]
MSESATVQVLPVQRLTPEQFAPFGQVIYPSPDGLPFGPDDAQLQLQNGIPRFYIMQLEHQGLRFHKITRHQQCTQCLGALEGKDWLIAVAPPGPAAAPEPEAIKAFRIPGNCFIKLEVGTWHAGPHFEADTISFYNLELSDTNISDHETCDLTKTFGLAFELT